MLRDLLSKTVRALDRNLLIALAALIVSGLTAASALYQTKMYSDQLSATVWPYLSFNVTESPSTIELTLENDGAGPAIIDGAEVLLDGKREPSMIAALKKMGLTSQGHRAWYTSIEPGQVIRPGASAMILKALVRNVAGRLGATYKRVDVNVYYCSLLNRCWSVRLHSTERPQEVTGTSYPHTSIGTE